MKRFAGSTIEALAAITLMINTPATMAGPGPGGPFGGKFADQPSSVIVDAMAKRLDLTDEQKTKITPIIDNTRKDLKKTAEGTKAILEKTKSDIAAVLTDEQKGKFEKMKKNVAGAVGGYLKTHGVEMRDKVKGAGEEIAVRAALGSLDLTDEQRGKLKELGEANRQKREAIMAEVKPKMEALREEMKASLQATLTEEQKAKLKKKMEDMPRPGRHRGDHKGPRAEADREPPMEPRHVAHGGPEIDPLLMELFQQ